MFLVMVEINKFYGCSLVGDVCSLFGVPMGDGGIGTLEIGFGIWVFTAT